MTYETRITLDPRTGMLVVIPGVDKPLPTVDLSSVEAYRRQLEPIIAELRRARAARAHIVVGHDEPTCTLSGKPLFECDASNDHASKTMA